MFSVCRLWFIFASNKWSKSEIDGSHTEETDCLLAFVDQSCTSNRIYALAEPKKTKCTTSHETLFLDCVYFTLRIFFHHQSLSAFKYKYGMAIYLLFSVCLSVCSFVCVNVCMSLCQYEPVSALELGSCMSTWISSLETRVSSRSIYLKF